MSIRRLPATEPRVETGPVRFGDDWPGTFIRGDSAVNYAWHLRALLVEQNDSPLSKCILRDLLSDLEGSNLTTGAAHE